jgi:hypothetical protein
MRRFVFVLVLLATLLSAAPSRPAVAAASITGLVWDDVNIDGVRQPEERGLKDVTVRLNGAAPIETKTDANGMYRFEGLAPGHYDIVVYTPGQYMFGTFPFRTINSPFSRGADVVDGAEGRFDFGVSGPGSLQQGVAWINGDQATKPRVEAFSDGIQCGFFPASYLYPPHSPEGAFTIAYPPAGYVNGCAEGSTITYTINLQPANETSVLGPPNTQRGSAPFPQPGPQYLTIGPAFAVYLGDVEVPDGYVIEGPAEVRAMVNGIDCGVPQPTQGRFYLTVLPASLRSGCAMEGSTVEFWLGEHKLPEAITWTPGFHDYMVLDLPASALIALPVPATPTPVLIPPRPAGIFTPPDTGDGGLVISMEASR